MSGKIGQCALQGEADGQAGSTQNGNEGGGSYANHRSHADEQESLEGKIYQACQEGYKGIIYLAFFESFFCEFGDP